MVRKVIEFTADYQRDKGKVFVIEEMSGFEAAKLLETLMGALGKISVLELNDSAISMGAHGLATIGVAMLDNVEEKERDFIREKLLSCVKIKTPTGPREFFEDDFEEWKTIRQVLDKVINLHFDFFDTADVLITPQESAPAN